MTLTLRNVKGSELTHAEMDGNFTHFRDLIALPTVTITDEAVAMLPNRRYVGSIAGFTADRNYTLPAGTAGDVIEVLLTAGDDAFELILLGASGVSINGGSAATEWSRLFISNEFVRFRCHATNDWRVEVDGRAFESCEIFGTATTAYVGNAVTKFTLGGSLNNGMTVGTNEIIPRRTGRFAVTAENVFQPSRGGITVLLTTFAAIGTTTYVGGSTRTIRAAKATDLNTANNYFATTPREVVVDNLLNAFAAWYYVQSVGSVNQYLTIEEERPSLRVRRVG